MKSFKEVITELFDKPVPFKWSIRKDDEWEGYFKVDGKKFMVLATALDEDGLVWEFLFAKASGMVPGLKATGEGGEIQVFSTVIAMMKQFTKEQNPLEIQISASKTDTENESRGKLYKRMIRTYSSKNGYKLSTTSNTKDTTWFTLRRK